MKDRKTCTLCLGILFLFGCSTPLFAHTDVTAEQARDMLDTTAPWVVLDVREEIEYCDAGGHIPGALNLPWNSGVLQEVVSAFDPDAEILIVCRSGNRSNEAALFLDGKGFTRVHDMLGGMLAWQGETETCAAPWRAPASVLGGTAPRASTAANGMLVLAAPVAFLLVLRRWKR